VQAATANLTGRTPTDTSNTVDFLWGSGGGLFGSYTVTGNNSGDFLDANSTTSHHYAIFGGTGSDVIIYNKQDASISGGSQGNPASWDTLALFGNDSITLNTTNSVTKATATDGISGGTTVSGLEILNISGYNVDSNGNPVINANGTVSQGTNSVTLHANDVLNMSSNTLGNLVSADSSFNQITNQAGVSSSDKVLMINGNSNSTVNLAEGNWTSVGTVQDSNGSHYSAFTHAGTSGGEALVLINTDITHIVGHT